jgi:hypothetical protein
MPYIRRYRLRLGMVIFAGVAVGLAVMALVEWIKW